MKLFDLINPVKLVQFLTLSFGGGGGGGSGTPYYANQDKLAGAQADIATNLYNQYANLAPGYLQNSQTMVNDAMNGTLAGQLRQQAGNDAAAANGNSWETMNRNMQRMGANFSTDRMLSEMNKNSIMGAANMSGALNNATMGAEDMKWNRNANAYGQIAGMSNGAMQGMGSAAASYGQMGGQMAQNSAANAAGWGKFGAGMTSGSRWADGGYIDKPGLHLASGGPAFQNYLKPVDWRSQATTAGAGKGPNQLMQGAQMLGTLAAMDMLGDAWRGDRQKDGTYSGGLKKKLVGEASTLWNKGKTALMESLPQQQQPQAPQQTGLPEMDGYAPGATFQTYPDPSAGDPSYAGGYGDYNTYTPSDVSYDELWAANGGYIKRGLHFATGGYSGYAQPVQQSDEGTDPWKFRGEAPNPYVNMAGNMATMKAMDEGMNYGAKSIKSAFNSPGADKSFVSSNPSTPTVASTGPVADPYAGMTQTTLTDTPVTVTPVADTTAGITQSALPEAGSTAANTVGNAVAEKTGEVATEEAAKLAAEKLTEQAATEALASTATTAAAEGTAATVAGTNFWNPVGWAAALYGVGKAADWWADGGPVPHEQPRRGLHFASGGYAPALAQDNQQYAGPYDHVPVNRGYGEKFQRAMDQGPGYNALADWGLEGGYDGKTDTHDLSTTQQLATWSGDPVLSYFAKANGGPINRVDHTKGGKVAGPGTETSDDIPAWLSDGEFVLNAEAVKLIGKDKLEALNNRGLAVRNGKAEEAAEGHPNVKDSPAEEKREARGLKKPGIKKAKGGPVKGKGMKLAKGGYMKKEC